MEKKEKKEQFICPNCGKVCQSEHTLKLHKRACDRKYNKKDDKPKEEEKTTDTSNEGLNEGINEGIKNKPKDIWKERNAKLQYIKSGKATYEKNVALGKMFTDITGKPQQSIDCPSCLYFMYKVCKKNIDKHLK